jgi:hypothetical protein
MSGGSVAPGDDFRKTSVIMRKNEKDETMNGEKSYVPKAH